MYVHYGHFKKNQKVLRASVNFWRPLKKLHPSISLYRFRIFRFCQVGGRTLNDHQIQSFEARDLFFYILSSSYTQNWICIEELTIIAHFEIFHRGGVPPPPGPSVAKIPPGLIGLNTKQMPGFYVLQSVGYISIIGSQPGLFLP